MKAPESDRRGITPPAESRTGPEPAAGDPLQCFESPIRRLAARRTARFGHPPKQSGIFKNSFWMRPDRILCPRIAGI
ncbi:hypothetical protein DENIS_2123 [Desulfonema ishimotonii]|uniref:Uncharacterized protein n=1 Tax=Desulfonema ishimotonii TaxID=45657 RepID=A0A401FW38_9BACT|nr:hypothetical protein [Desulfonema ishimotonii]GBC61163.1 hypothetical protein DENIS_2123 [Desulfonema ishimotonii]